MRFTLFALGIVAMVALANVAAAETLDLWNTEADAEGSMLRLPKVTIIRYDIPSLSNVQEQTVEVGQTNTQTSENTNINVAGALAANANLFRSRGLLARRALAGSSFFLRYSAPTLTNVQGQGVIVDQSNTQTSSNFNLNGALGIAANANLLG